ncbi:uncharacterized protein LOC133194264 [Saccostrea echinata]|uniref:uncharacterized protein LOC133194264 n=1 Tax=Saccostrea echinata TaxID=191078 RepID=UPI002A83D1A2|nr:uncharacterized protein LOC133194264 [Saccostrea echinata]
MTFVRATILKRDFRSDMEVVYTVKILWDFKVYNAYVNQKPHIFGKWTTSLCNFSPQVKYLTPYIRTALYLGIYKNNCDCNGLQFLFQ